MSIGPPPMRKVRPSVGYRQVRYPSTMKATPSVSSKLSRTLASPRRRYIGRRMVEVKDQPEHDTHCQPDANGGQDGHSGVDGEQDRHGGHDRHCP